MGQLSGNKFLASFNKIIDMILEQRVDDSLKDNLRIALLKKIAIPCLEKAATTDVI